MSIRLRFIAAAALSVLGSSAFADSDSDTATARLERALSPPHAAPTALSGDPVLASFQRMLSHEPNRVAPAVPANFEADPLIEALALPVLRWSAEGRRQTLATR